MQEPSFHTSPPDPVAPPNHGDDPYHEFIDRNAEEIATANTKRIVSASEILRNNLTVDQVVALLDSGQVIQMRRSIRGEVPLLLLWAFTFLLAVITTFRVPSSISYVDVFPGPRLYEIGISMYFFVPLVVIFALIHRLYNRRYTLTKDNILTAEGFFRFRSRFTQIEYRRFKEVIISQNIFQRMLSVGDVLLSFLSVAHPEMVLAGVHNPSFYTEVLRRKVAAAQQPFPQASSTDPEIAPKRPNPR
jgi:uncharacterized membrane protein YdbT with pleckstrin-like domain